MTAIEARRDALGGIVAKIDGVERSVPEDGENADYRSIIAAGIEIAAYTPPSPTATDVRREASRRIQVLVGARDTAHLETIVSNASREAIRLLRKGEANWSAAERDRADELALLDSAIEAIRAASNVLENAPPLDYEADRHWPSGRPLL